MGVPRRTPEQLEPSWIEAYTRWTRGESLPAIAAALAGPPHFCGGKTTAHRWVEEGQRVMAAKGDPLRKARVQRERLVDALDAIRVEARVPAAAGELTAVAMLKIELAAIEKAARIGGYEAPRVKVRKSGDKPAQLPVELFESLGAYSVDELLDALQNQNGTLPDGRNQR